MAGVGASGRIARAFIDNKLTPLLVAAALALGVLAVVATPREEEPQIVVPMIDVLAPWPGAEAAEVERLVAVPLERALREIPEVEYVYSTSRPSGAMVIARFFVNSDPSRALVGVRDKVANAIPSLPAGALAPSITPRSIDDVPILALTFSSGRYDPLALRRMASEIEEQARAVSNVAATSLLGGLRREIRVEPDPERLASRGLAPAAVFMALEKAGASLPAGSFGAEGRETVVETGDFLAGADDVGAVVVAAPMGRAVRLGDVARVSDGPEEPRSYVFHAEAGRPTVPAVTLAVSKTRGANATVVADAVLRRIEAVRGRLLPADVTMTVTRNYGETAQEKSSELIFHLLLATISVVALMALALGLREAVVVAVAVPVTLALTLLIYYVSGYTLNRVTLFALIFSIGILVDDAIVVVENIHRHMALRKLPPLQAAVFAVDEVGNPTILATFTVIAAILPMAFVTGLMGPYMRPIPVGASFAMLISLLVAFVVSPWLAFRMLRGESANRGGKHASPEGIGARAYRRLMEPLLRRPAYRWGMLLCVSLLLLLSLALVPLKLVTVKMLPFDNKSEMQVIVDAPEGTTLEATLAAAQEMADRIGTEPEVRDVQVYAGTSAPFNFNGLVRHYFARRQPNKADLQVNLLPKRERRDSSHAIAGRIRPLVAEIARRRGVRVKVAEIPPGPPVLSTLVAEVYGPDPAVRQEVARKVLAVFDATPGVVDTDWYVEAPQPKARFVVDRDRAALSGIEPEQVAMTLRLAVDGLSPAVAHPGGEREPVPITVRLPLADRSSARELGGLRLLSAAGTTVPLQEVSRLESGTTSPFLYRKNGRPVTYVIGDVAGTEESPAYAILKMSDRIRAITVPGGYAVDERMVDDPRRGDHEAVVWDGEWRITYEVFRDLGVAFGAVLILIYILVVAWFRSFAVPLLIMAPIPLTLVGILPGHALTGVFFTATSMIGMIALAGIIVRNSILLVDFIELSLERGLSLHEAVLEAGAVRFRPIALTGAAVVVGGVVMVLDPIFQGLAVALMSGVLVSTALTLVVIPLLYFMMMRRRVPAPAGAREEEAP
ncbi:MAG: efflux RND transporter permease subunit [Acidobacteriia bacterium]|nr:efflux RND transporter permease subunit [Terriglobia bacterium]